jgi:hypothetical protein
MKAPSEWAEFDAPRSPQGRRRAREDAPARPQQLSKKDKAQALVDYGECANLAEARAFLADAGW